MQSMEVQGNMFAEECEEAASCRKTAQAQLAEIERLRAELEGCRVQATHDTQNMQLELGCCEEALQDEKERNKENKQRLVRFERIQMHAMELERASSTSTIRDA